MSRNRKLKKDVENTTLEELHYEAAAAHEDTEGVWLISYADLMTLLMGFFALMLSMADLEPNKFAKVGETTAEYFGGEVDKPYEDISESIKDLLKEKNLEGKVVVESQKTQIVLTFEGTLLFASGNFKLKKDADILMKELLVILKDKAGEKKVLVEGHTDDNPINSGIIASNWELSSLRANSVARLFETYGFKRNQIMTLGFAETRPLVDNRGPNGEPIVNNQAKNRRIILKVMDNLPL